jgi:hypothetical protein
MGIDAFRRYPLYHAELTATILEMEQSPAFRDWIFKGGCGMKVRRPDRWGRTAAGSDPWTRHRVAHRVLSPHDVYTDDCWASVYRDGAILPAAQPPAVERQHRLPAGRRRSRSGRPDGGQLVFADPRIPHCCQQEPGA